MVIYEVNNKSIESSRFFKINNTFLIYFLHNDIQTIIQNIFIQKYFFKILIKCIGIIFLVYSKRCNSVYEDEFLVNCFK